MGHPIVSSEDNLVLEWVKSILNRPVKGRLTGYSRDQFHKTGDKNFKAFCEIVSMLECITVTQGLLSTVTLYIHHKPETEDNKL